jgi:glycosyltransferase involved in cell wall biosynthesis
MRIGIDARELAGRATGVGRYVAGLLDAWSQDPAAPRHDFVLYSHEPLAITVDSHRFPSHVVAGPPGTWWEQVQLPAACLRDHLDVLFAPAYTAPLFRRVPFVVTIHDVSFAAHPEWFRTREGLRRRWITRHSARQARSVVTVSEFSRGEIVDHLGVPPGKVHVIPHGIHAHAAPSRTSHGTRRPHLLFVGSIFNRRRVPDLLRAFAPIAANHDTVLDLVGDNRSHPRQNIAGLIEALGLQRHVRWHAYVAEDELARLYGEATAFAFLSEYEGFGLTPLEALAAGLPPVLLDTAIARESCGNAALYVEPDDLAGTTRALEAALFDEAVRARLLGAAPSVLGRYDQRRAARQTLAVIEGAA